MSSATNAIDSEESAKITAAVAVSTADAEVAATTKAQTKTKKKQSGKTETRKDKEKETESKPARKKRGNKGNFFGEQLEFLERWFVKYTTLDGKKKGFWADFFPVWWASFPWKGVGALAVADAAKGDVPEKAEREATTAEGGAASFNGNSKATSVSALEAKSMKEDVKEKKALEERLKRWFSNRQTRESRVTRNPFSDWISQLSKHHKRPRRTAEHKFYMTMAEHVDKVTALYDERYPGCEEDDNADEDEEDEEEEEEDDDDEGDEDDNINGKKKSIPQGKRLALSRRVAIAAELFKLESATTQKDIRKARDDDFDERMKVHRDFKKAIADDKTTESFVSEELQDECRKNIATVAQPLLNIMRHCTGCHFTLVGGAPPRDPDDLDAEWTLLTLHAGKTQDKVPKTFSEWSPATFRDKWMAFYVKFLWAANGRGIYKPKDAAETAQAEWKVDVAADAMVQPEDLEGLITLDAMDVDKPEAPIQIEPLLVAETVHDERTAPPGSKKRRSQRPSKKGKGHTAIAGSSDEDDSSSSSRWTSEDEDMGEEEKDSSAEGAAGTETLPDGVVMGAELAAEVAALDDILKRKRMRELTKAARSEYAWTRENTMARNRALLRDLGVQHDLRDLGDLLPKEKRKEKKRKRAAETSALVSDAAPRRSGRTIALTSKSTLPDEEAPSEEASSAMSSLAGIPEIASPRLLEPPKLPASPNTFPETATVNDNSQELAVVMPVWMVKAEASLAGIEDPSWTALLMKWRAWEQCFGFAQEGYNKEKLGGAKIRPEAVEWWTKRKRIPTPDIGDREVFARKWWLWWIHVNPDWRIKSNEGFLERKGDGDWSSMKISGVNGFLSLLICLRWWIGAASGEKEASWSEAVADMSWALDQLMELRKREEEEGDNSEPSKKKLRSSSY